MVSGEWSFKKTLTLAAAGVAKITRSRLAPGIAAECSKPSVRWLESTLKLFPRAPHRFFIIAQLRRMPTSTLFTIHYSLFTVYWR